MIVEQPEAFKSWLTAVLKPMCDADPAALAKYVLALIKKDKADDDLRKSMVAQLEVFLEDETETFVTLLFDTLQSQDYINTPVIPNANPPNPNIVKKEEKKETKVIVPPSDLPNLNEQVNGDAPASAPVVPVVLPKKENEIKRDRETRKSDDKERDKEEKPPTDKPTRPLRPRHRSTSRNRSRSRSWDRSKRSRSRSRDRGDLHREKRVRVWRNKSPPPMSRRHDRRGRSRTPPSPLGVPGLMGRVRSPRRHRSGGRYRNRSRGRGGSGSRSRSRSRSLEKPRRDSLKDKELSRPGTPTQDSNHGDMDLRLTNSTQSIQSIVATVGKKRCRDFDEKGYCMQGEMCLFDHGVDPVVLEDTALTSVLQYNTGPGGPDVPGVIPPVGMPPGHPMGPRGVPPEYNPQAPQMWNRGGFRGPRPMGMPRGPPPMGMFAPPPNMNNRELIPVPVMDNKPNHFNMNMNMYPHPNQHPFMGGHPMDHQHQFNNKKKNFDYNRLGPRPKNPINCSLCLRKVPPGLNSITHLNNHFSKFGKIVNIQVSFEGDSESALVTFSTNAEANAAYRSTEAVLNNRFIKVFWHNAANAEVQPTSDKPQVGVEPETSEEKKAAMAAAKEETKAQQTAAILKSQELLAAKEKLKKNQDEQRKEVLKMKQDLRKRKQELLEKQLSQQKILIEKMEKLPAGQQRDLIKDTIKKTQESIETIRKDIASTTLTPAKTTLSPSINTLRKSKEDTEKELLDMELELDILSKQDGVDTTDLQKKIAELKARTSFMSVRGGRGRGRARYTPIGRHLLTKNNLVADGLKGHVKVVNKATLQKHTVDHRPTRLLVSGYEADEQDNVITHFKQFGEIVNFETDATLPSVTLHFKTRIEAEMALLKGKHFEDRTLSVTWSSAAPSIPGRTPTRKTSVISESDDVDDHLIEQSLLEGADEEAGAEVNEEILLQDDEEEDDENEDRSWRR